MRRRLLSLGIAASFLAIGAAGAQRPATPGGPGGGPRGGGEDSSGVPAVENVSTTKHTVTIGGKTIAYTANAGTMVLRDDEGKPKATVLIFTGTGTTVSPASERDPSAESATSARIPRIRQGTTWCGHAWCWSCSAWGSSQWFATSSVATASRITARSPARGSATSSQWSGRRQARRSC